MIAAETKSGKGAGTWSSASRLPARLAHRHFSNDLRDRRDQRIGVCVRMNEHAATPHAQLLVNSVGNLTEGMINRESYTWDDVLVVHIGGDSDDAARPGADVDELHHRVSPHDMAIERI